MKNIIGIMATTKDGVIGYKNGLPWHYPEELEYFKNITLNHTVIMGRKTYEATPSSLFQDRNVLVLSKNTDLKLDKAKVFSNLKDCLKCINKSSGNSKFFMVGGSEIADLFLADNLISSFLLTEIKNSYNGDVYLKLSLFQGWHKKIIKITENYNIYLLTKPNTKILTN